MSARLPAWSAYAGVLAAAGLPIYIYAPKFYADTYGVSLTALGAILFGLRLFDVVQDPVLGWIGERLREGRARAAAIGAAVLAAAMLALFAVPPPVAPVLWFAFSVTALFTAFSFLSILFYAEGVAKAARLEGGHMRLAAWRESGALAGVCLAAILPALLAPVTGTPFAIFAGLFAGAVLLAALGMRREWRSGPARTPPVGIRAILSDPLARRLLVLALVNATPLAVSSTLFLFFVESRLAAPGWEGPLLVLFFLAAALSAPAWSALARRFGAKRVLLSAMALAVGSFAVTLTLGPGDAVLFAVICVLSGASIGADLTLLPAIFARRMGEIAPNAGQGFGLWGLVNKFTLAFAAVTLLPLLEGAGFVAGDTAPPEEAARMLTLLYALVPVVLKLLAMALLSRLTLDAPANPGAPAALTW